MSDIAELTLKIDSSSGDVAHQILDKLASSAKGTETSFDTLATAGGKLAVVLGPAALAGAFALMVKSAVELQDHYVRLSEIAGTTASQIGAMDLPARLSGTSLDAVAQSISKLNRSIGEAQLGDVAKKGLFKALGIDPTSGADAADQFYNVAKSIMSMKDTNVQAYVAQQLLGRSFAEMRPFMKEVVEQGGLMKRVTDEDARAAKELKDNLEKLHYELEIGKATMANKYVPWLTDVAKAFTVGYKEGGLLKSVIEGIQTAISGSDLYKANKDLFELTEKMLRLEKQVEAARAQILNPVPLGPRGDPSAAAANRGDSSLAMLEKSLEETKRRIAAVQFLKAEIEKSQAGGTAGSRGASEDIDAEAKIRKQMEDARLLEERVAVQKGYGERYAAAIDTANALAQEANKQGLINDENLILQISANNKAKLEAQAVYLAEIRRLYAEVGKGKEAQEAQNAIEQVNAAIVAGDAIATAKVSSLSATRVKAYEDWRQSALNAGQDVAASLQDELDVEQASYEKRRQMLDVFLKEAGAEYAQAAYLRENLEIQHQQKLLAIERNKHQAERSMQIGTAQLAADLLQQFAGKSKIAALAVIAINKALAMAQVIQATGVAIMRAYADLGPIAGSVAAASIATLGAVQLGLIAATGLVEAYQATQGGGGGSINTGGGFGGGNINPGTTPLPVTDVSAREVTVIHLHGDVFTKDMVRDLLEQLGESIRDGGRIEVAG
jgi:hypothetical protein